MSFKIKSTVSVFEYPPEGQFLFNKVRDFIRLPQETEDDMEGWNEYEWLRTLSAILFLALDEASRTKKNLSKELLLKAGGAVQSKSDKPSRDLIELSVQRLKDFFVK